MKIAHYWGGTGRTTWIAQKFKYSCCSKRRLR